MLKDRLNNNTVENHSQQSTSWDDIELEDPDRKYDHKMYQAALAFCGLPPDYNRTFHLHARVEKETGKPALDKNGKQIYDLWSCNPSKACLEGNAVWTQVN